MLDGADRAEGRGAVDLEDPARLRLVEQTAAQQPDHGAWHGSGFGDLTSPDGVVGAVHARVVAPGRHRCQVFSTFQGTLRERKPAPQRGVTNGAGTVLSRELACCSSMSTRPALACRRRAESACTSVHRIFTARTESRRISPPISD